jgi:hypothetical protein
VRRFAALARQRDGVRGAVVLDDRRMIDGDVRHTLLEVADGEPSRMHELLDESVGFRDRRTRVIHEPRLNGAPRGGVPIRVRRR